jgi:chemotaxis receptor (MCP) glutamine deamidase CheD
MLTSPGFQDAFQIGTENIKTAQDLLQKMGVRPVETDLGGTAGRTVRLYVVDGKMTVRTVAGVERIMGPPPAARQPAAR